MPSSSDSPGEQGDPEPKGRWPGWLQPWRGRWEHWWSGLTPNLRGSIWLLGAGIVFAIMAALIKQAGQRLPVVEILFFRQMFVIVFMAPAIAKGFPAIFETKVFGLHMIRIGLATVAMTSGFTAIVNLPLAEAAAISFSRTLFTTMLAVLILKEIVGWRRWTATAVGFLGVLVVVRPSPEGLNEYAMLALLSAMFVAGIMISIRMLTRTERPATIMAYQAVCLTIILAPPTWYFWVTPTWQELVLLAVIGGVMSVAQFLNIKAYANGEAAALAPVEYVRLLTAAGLGFMVFAEVPTIYTAIGATIIIASTLYTVRRSALKKQQSAGPADDS